MGDLPTGTKRIAVLGADSFIGSYFYRALSESGYDCIGTTRRIDRVEENLIHLDLTDDRSWRGIIEVKPDVAIAFFAVSKLDQCERDSSSHEINVSRVPALIKALAEEGCRTVFLSTNSIFGGERQLCNEDDSVSPQIAYSRQKYEAEQRIRELVGDSSYAIVRITRTISEDLSPFDEWLQQLQIGQIIEAFDDFIFAPITLSYITSSLLKIALCDYDGIFHLSGVDVSYYDFACEICRRLELPEATVNRTNSVAKGVNLRFRPSYSALGMRRTAALLDIEPQATRAVISQLISSP